MEKLESDIAPKFGEELSRAFRQLETKKVELDEQIDVYNTEKKRYDVLNAELEADKLKFKAQTSMFEAETAKFEAENAELNKRKEALDTEKRFHDELEKTFFTTVANKVAAKSIVRFNVRDTIIETTPEICNPSGYLHSLLTTKMEVQMDKTGAILIDVDPDLFKILLNALSLFVMDESAITTVFTEVKMSYRRLYSYLELYEFMAISVPIYAPNGRFGFKFTQSFVYQYDDIEDYKTFFTSADTTSINIFKVNCKEIKVNLYLKYKNVKDIFDCQFTDVRGNPIGPDGFEMCIIDLKIKIKDDKFIIHISCSDSKAKIKDYQVFTTSSYRGCCLKCEYPIDDFITRVDRMEAV